MNFYHIDEACKMHWAYFTLTTLLLTCVAGSVILDSSHCNYVYNDDCRSSRNVVAGLEYRERESHGSCAVDDIRNDVKFTVQSIKYHAISSGIVKVNFTLPDAECNYEVALLVNSSITNDKDCKNHVFHKTDSYEYEIHTAERTICVLPSSNPIDGNNCKRDKFSMWYEHVFSGCYALRFTIDGYKYSVIGNKFIVTDYTRREVTEPKFRCHYEDQMDAEASKQELVTFALSMSVHADTAGMILTLTPMSHPEETKENACVLYSEQPLYTWEISTNESVGPAAIPKRNCSLKTIRSDNETYTREGECNFDLRASRNVSYCLKIRINDERCNRQTIWDPPPRGRDKPACDWLQSCTRIVKNVSSVIEYNGILRNNDGTNIRDNETLLLVPIAIAIFTFLLVIMAIMLFVCRFYRRIKARSIYVNTNLRDLRIARCNVDADDSAETTDDETTRSPGTMKNAEDNETEPIILLYARGTNSFMNLMSDFRDILRIHCRCRVRDWYDASEWNDVARIGPAPWVADLLRQKHRAVWLDTPRARNLLNPQRRKNYSVDTGDRVVDDEDGIGDFRDVALATVVDLAKRNVASLGYNKHFIVRLEGFDGGNERDPFEGLSPHTRYLIPHHLSELCSHLSSWPTNKNSARSFKTEEAQLRERLVRMSLAES